MASSLAKTLKKSHQAGMFAAGGGVRYAGPFSASLATSAAASQSLERSSAPASQSLEGSSAPSSPSSQSQEKERGLVSKLLLFFPGAITFGLGTWQLFRRQDKIEMLDYRQKRLEIPPVNVDALSPEGLQSLEFRRVVCRGVFDEKSSVFIGPRSRSISGVTENGYYIITPLMPILGDPQSIQSTVLVNRGWVPRIWRDKSMEASNDSKNANATDSPVPSSSAVDKIIRWWKFWSKKSERVLEESPVADVVEVIGVVRGSEKPSIFVPGNDPVSGQWFYVDVPAIAESCGLSQETIYVEHISQDVNPSNPYPIPKDANTLIHSSVMPQDHLNYTFTWYSLSAAVTFMAYKRLQPRKRYHTGST